MSSQTTFSGQRRTDKKDVQKITSSSSRDQNWEAKYKRLKKAYDVIYEVLEQTVQCGDAAMDAWSKVDKIMKGKKK